MPFLTLLFSIFLFTSSSVAALPLDIETLEDPQKQWSLDHLVQPDSKLNWTKVSAPLSIGFSWSRHWIRFRMPPEALSQKQPLFLVVPYTYLGKVTFSTTQGERILQQQVQGLAVQPSASTRPATGSFNFEIPFSSDLPNQAFYVSVEGTFPLSVPLQIQTLEELQNHQTKRSLLLGFFFGSLLVMILFNWFLALATKWRLFTLYCLYTAALLLMFASHERITAQWLWPEWQNWLGREIHVFGGFAFFFYICFFRSFLQTRRLVPRLDRFLLALLAVSTLRALWQAFADDQIAVILGQSAIVVSNLMVLGIAFYGVLKKETSALYFLLASFVFHVGYIFYNLHISNILPSRPFIEFAPHFGILIESFLLSFALTDKVRQTQRMLHAKKIEIFNSEKMAALGRMAASISHEINNPLSIIGAQTYSLARATNEGLISSEKISKSCQTIEKNVDRISRIIKSMRIVARDSSQDPVSAHKLSEILTDVINLSTERLRREKIDFSLATPADDLTVWCRSSEICQILINLLNNAIDAVQGVPEKKISLRVRQDSKQVLISVLDNGEGVPENRRQQIFEPFFTSKPVGQGTGLGLSISKSLIQNHGGDLWLEPHPQLTQFTFSLPSPN